MALANRTVRQFTTAQRAALIRSLRSGLVLDFVQTQLITCNTYQRGAAQQWALGNPLGWYNKHMAAMHTFLDGCLVPNPQGIGSNSHG